MEIGMLWFDNDKGRDLSAKVARAAEHYERKFGRWPDLCFVHPSQLPGGSAEFKAGGVAVKASQTVLPYHFWLGSAE